MKLLLLLLLPIQVLATSGDLTLLTFKDGNPQANVEMVLDGVRKIKSDSEGIISLGLKHGKHFIEIKIAEEVQSIPFVVAKGEVTEIILNLYSDKKQIESDISQPKLIGDISPDDWGVIQGRVLDDNAKPIHKARIFITGVTSVVLTNKNGVFKVNAPKGKRTVSIVHNKFSTGVFKDLVVEKKKTLNKSFRLLPASLELDEFVVVAPHIKGSLGALIEVRRKSSNVAEVLGSEQISKSGDSDAASSLGRVTGLTIVDGKYVYIRGLGERYSNVLLNGTALSSPDPTRRVVQLDLFPSGILDSLVIQKSYSPDLPGDFGGGTVSLNTKDIPEKFTAKVSMGTSYASGNSQIRKYNGGRKDWLGYDDGTRALPSSIEQATANGGRIFQDNGLGAGYSVGELKSFSKDMSRNYNLDDGPARVPPSLSLSIGDLFKYRGQKYGYLISGLYSDKWDNSTKTKYNYKSDGTEDNSREIDESKRTVKLSGMLNLGAYLGKWADFRSNTLILRKSTDKIKTDVKSSDSDSDANYRDFSMEWQERQLFGQILSGKHQLGKNKKRLFEWRYSFNQATREQPDSRSYQQDFKDGEYVTSTAGKRNEKLYNSLEDTSQDVSFKFALPIVEFDNFDFLAKVGFQYIQKDRESETKRFKYGQIDAAIAQSVTGNPDVLTNSLEEICTDAVIDAGGCILEDSTSASDRYSAKQSIRSYFVDSESRVMDFMKLNIGARLEESRQSILTYQGVDREIVESGLNMEDILPVYRVTFFLSDSLQLRGAYSETVSRPDFKDLNPGSYFDDEKGRSVSGNLGLKGTVIKNYDARLEWYFGKNENISLGYFEKQFVNPIEEVAGAFNDDNQLVFSEGSYQLANVGNAQTTGFEVEARKNFAFIHYNLENLSIGGNYARIQSEMDIFDGLTSQLTNSSRPLQGQSPYVVNVNLDYDNKDSGTTATVLYNIFGERIDAVGTKPYGDVYEQPFSQLDLVFSQKILENYKVKFKIKNIIDPVATKTEDGRVKEIYRKGRSGSFSFSGTF